ncbi:flagellar basal body P-ring formation chaperone FlgA [Zooshikella harenae]|uniref:Flagellar basal body P-ring formation protein FlgA n=1 Tax=Zooshikella harenae TaxID=2827238 RepID=A0ABS5ZC70_9GAMM|nr:flagellar basal body P-ring formation chaperone FlgA [Zooshikella harenae]MBU2711653.1 flagellar basal body P-ring formation protein FlgA [Zooshikella harenae]
MLKNKLLSAIIINLLILPILSIEALGGTILELPPAVTVQDSNPVLGKIVKLISTTESPQKITKALNQKIILGLKPADYKVLTKTLLERNLTIVLNEFHIRGFDSVKVTREGYIVPVKKLLTQAKHFLNLQLAPLAEEVIIKAISDIPEVYINEQHYNLSFKRNSVSQFLKRTCVWITVKTKTNIRTVPIWFDVTLKQHAWILSQSQQANSHFHHSQVTSQLIDIAKYPITKLVKNPQKLKHRYKRNLPTGTVLLATHIEELPAVEKNAVVIAQATHNGITIKTQVKALQDGNINQRIKLQSLSSGEFFYGIVTNTNMIHVTN